MFNSIRLFFLSGWYDFRLQLTLWRLQILWPWRRWLKGLYYHDIQTERDNERRLAYLDQLPENKLDPEKLLTRGGLRVQKKRFDEALTDYTQLINDPAAASRWRFPAFNQRALIYVQIEEWDKALYDLEQALEIMYIDQHTIINFCSILISHKPYEEALGRINERVYQPVACLFSSLLYFRAGQIEKAHSDALTFFSKSVLRLTLWSKEEMFLLLRDNLDWAKQLAVWGEEAGQPLVQSHSLLAYALWDAGSYQEALELFERISNQGEASTEEPEKDLELFSLHLSQAELAQGAGMFDYARSKYNWLLKQKYDNMLRLMIWNSLLTFDRATQQALSAK
jgi:tetratricopeptide (TPR) repeat protein